MDRHSLTPDIVPLLVALIRAGASLSSAAGAAGVPRRTFADWLRRGRESEEPPYGPFYQEVMQARGQVQAAVETEVRKKDPKFWLRYGPGKAAGKSRKGRRFDSVIPQSLIELLPVLDPFPAARQALVEHIERTKDASAKRR